MRNAWVEVSHSQRNVDATSQHSYGKNNKSTREYKTPTPVKLYIQLGRSTKVLENIKLPSPLKLKFL